MSELLLTGGRVALVDDDDLGELQRYAWRVFIRYVGRKVYVGVKNGRDKYGVLYLHRAIMHAPSDMEVDHINGDPFDNRRLNLRLCTSAQNKANRGPRAGSTSKYKGVRYLPRNVNKVWAAEIRFNGKSKYIGAYATEDEAALAYNKVASVLQGEFAYLNLIAMHSEPSK